MLDLLQLDLHLLAELEVECPERFVEQQHLRPVDERAGQRDPLPLAARELRRLPLPELRRAGPFERLSDALPPLSFGTCFTIRPYSTFSATVMCGNSA